MKKEVWKKKSCMVEEMDDGVMELGKDISGRIIILSQPLRGSLEPRC